MKRKKLLSILLAGAMIGTAPASAWAADFTDENISMAEDVTEGEAAEEDVSEQQEADDSEDAVAEIAESDEEQTDAEELSQAEDIADSDQSVETYAQEDADPFSDGEAAVTFDDNQASGDLTLAGTGTEADPYLVTSTADIQAIADYVNSGKGTFANQYLKFTEDITLPEGWTPIGIKTSKFQGNLDGDNHLLTVPKGEKCLFGYVADSTLKNLNIYGEQIASDGVVCNYEVDYRSYNPIKIDNVTLKAGTQTLKSGFIGGYASGNNQITITNSTVEKGVVIGYDKAQSNIGSFGGDFNGTIENCVSYADVYGTKYVGGISGNKGQSMGNYTLKDCKFYGTVTASGNYAGGISGGGYGGTMWGEASAPNTPGVTIQNCYSNGTITGKDYVGGILGSETGMVQCWENGTQYVQNNSFEGTVSATDGTRVGGVIGYIKGIDKYNVIENNEYTCKGVKGIGAVDFVDTSYANPAPVEGVTYYSSENGRPSGISGATKAQQNRTDDPLGVDADKLVRLVAPKIKVSLTILGDHVHDSDADHEYHTYYAGNLETWLEQSEYTVVEGSTAKDVIDAALLANNMTCDNPSGNYIASITKDGVTLGEFTNGKNSGWMDTINGVYPEVGIAEQKVQNNDQIVLHYTDWYGEEGVHTWSEAWTSDENAHWHECTDGGWCNISSNERKNGYAAHTFGEGKVTKKATYTEKGAKTYTCTVCGYEKTEELPVVPHQHKWDNGKVTKAATCKTTGIKTYTCSVCGKTKTEKIPVTSQHKWNNGKVTKAATCKTTGVKTYTCSVCGKTKTEKIPVIAHTYTWKTTAKATVFKPAVQTKVCSKCGYKTKSTRPYGKKLTPTLKLNVTKFTLKVNQLTTRVKATGLANGDSVKSWTSSNKNIVTVNSKGEIKAGKKTGTAKITVTLKSGKKGYITVTVQKTAVKTTKISGVKSSLTLTKGKKTTLKPVISPFTSTEKITYTTSNKNVATVNSKGEITAKKKGTATITVKSGNKKVTCKVTVK